MHGKGSGVVLGYEENLSEPLVLGNTLVSILKEIIDNINKISKKVEVSQSNIEDIILWINLASPIIGVTAPAFEKLNFSTTSEEIENLEKIKNNLSDILSRFSKTS